VGGGAERKRGGDGRWTCGSGGGGGGRWGVEITVGPLRVGGGKRGKGGLDGNGRIQQM